MLMNESSRRCITSVGTRIEGSTSRTSNSPIRASILRMVAGEAASRSSRPAHSMKLGSLTSLGATPATTWPSPQRSTCSSIFWVRTSAGQANS